ncbi:hypothetical protein C8J56DRAFT_899782 [Mycena floridula]|nr:hypothetical protein C8J56DRAFT_899782 [Mycena floridula]
MSIASGMPSNSVSSPKYIGLGVAEAIIQSFEIPHSTKCNPEKHQHCQANWEDQWFKKISFRLLDPDDMHCPAFLVAALENIKHHDMVPECRKLKLPLNSLISSIGLVGIYWSIVRLYKGLAEFKVISAPDGPNMRARHSLELRVKNSQPPYIQDY